MSKYKKGQTWPAGEFKSGLMLTFSDKELREGVPSWRNVRIPTRPDGSSVVESKRTIHDTHLRLEPYTYYPAGKPLKTDTAIRRFRKKHIFGTPELKRAIKWVVRGLK